MNRTISKPKPQGGIYEHKVKKEHIIYSQTILHSRITGEELSHNIKEFFGDTITPQFINKLRRKQMVFRPPLGSVLNGQISISKIILHGQTMCFQMKAGSF